MYRLQLPQIHETPATPIDGLTQPFKCLAPVVEAWDTVKGMVIAFFQGQTLKSGQLDHLHRLVNVVIKGRSSNFVAQSIRNELLPVGMSLLRHPVVAHVDDPESVVEKLVHVWKTFFCDIIHVLESVFIPVKLKSSLTIRHMCLLGFRDHVILKLNLEPLLDALIDLHIDFKEDFPLLQQLFLILQSVQEHYPPQANQLQLEKLVARVVNPYLGYLGLYEGKAEPTIVSDELKKAKEDIELEFNYRRLSRPVTLSSCQLENLHELFRKTAERSISIGRKISHANLESKAKTPL